MNIEYNRNVFCTVSALWSCKLTFSLWIYKTCSYVYDVAYQVKFTFCRMVVWPFKTVYAAAVLYRFPDLPKKPVDMIISALDNHASISSNSAPWFTAAVEWANSNKASILAIDPPLGKIGVVAKWSIAVALPFALDESCGQIYLCDLGLPQKLYREAGLSVYHSPFAHTFIIPLHAS